jgi:hypothetical protein
MAYVTSITNVIEAPGDMQHILQSSRPSEVELSLLSHEQKAEVGGAPLLVPVPLIQHGPLFPWGNFPMKSKLLSQTEMRVSEGWHETPQAKLYKSTCVTNM